MQAIFVVAVVLSSVIHIVRRRLDVFSLAHVSAVTYFSPGFVGHDGWLRPLSPGVYAIYVAVLVGVMATALFRDLVLATMMPRRDPATPATANINVMWVLTISMAVFVVIALATSGGALLVVHKNQSGIPGWAYIGMRISSSLLLLYGVVTRSRIAAVSGLLGVLVVFLAADRTNVAILASSAVLWLGMRRTALLRPRYILAALLLVFAIVWGKVVFTSVRIVAVEGVSALPAHVAGIDWLAFVRNSEPMTTQAILNRVVEDKWIIGPSHLAQLPAEFLPFGGNASLFNDLFQYELFRVSSYGMAYNFWAEAYATGGYFMVGVFVATFCMSLLVLDWLQNTARRPFALSVLLYVAPWVAFYIHRNSSATVITYVVHIVYAALAVVLVASAWRIRERPVAGALSL